MLDVSLTKILEQDGYEAYYNSANEILIREEGSRNDIVRISFSEEHGVLLECADRVNPVAKRIDGDLYWRMTHDDEIEI